MDTEEISRRIWLLRLGGGVVLAGSSGADLWAADRVPLPPGLYEPSIDHLAHVLKPATAGGPPAGPHFFSAAEYQQVQGLIARMLGEERETAPVPEIAAWIDLVVHDAAAVRQEARSLPAEQRALAAAFYGAAEVRELESRDVQAICRDGLARLRAEPGTTLEALESAGDPFILWLKRRVIEGFYTSQIGLRELDYKGNAFYSESPGCEKTRG